MPFWFAKFQVVSPQLDGTEMGIEAQAYNRSLLAEGVKGKAVLDVRPPTREERDLYEPFVPFALCVLSSVEVYEDGSMNIFAKSRLSKRVLGAIIVRPLT